jgi:hypothetical protein
VGCDFRYVFTDSPSPASQRMRKEVLQGVLPPANVPYAKAPKLPPYVWSRMQQYDCLAVSLLQTTQQVSSTPIFPLLRAIESVNVSDEVNKRQVVASSDRSRHDWRNIL